MRRADREVKDIVEILEILEKCESCSLGLMDGDMPYIVPLNFGYTYDNQKLILYFHGAAQGKKLDLMRKNSNAFFLSDCDKELYAKGDGCSYTMRYKSVTARGNVEILDDTKEKRRGLDIIMQHYAKGKTFDFNDKVLEMTAVIKMTVSEFWAKKNEPNG